MIDLKKAILPSAVMVDGSFFAIHTDFQFWLIVSSMLNDGETHLLSEFDFLYIADKPKDRQKGLDELMKFGFEKHPLPRSVGRSSSRAVFDWEQDAELVYAAFMEVYGIDICDENLHLHWWKFQALFHGLHNTKLNDVMGYRSFDENDKSDYKKVMQTNRRMWELERKLNKAEQKALDEFDAQFK